MATLTHQGLRRMLSYGTGAGIEIAGDTLRVVLVRARPTGPRLLAETAGANTRGFSQPIRPLTVQPSSFCLAKAYCFAL
jgi:hypothetical protein